MLTGRDLRMRSQDIELSRRDSFRFSQQLSHFATRVVGITDDEAAEECANSASEDEQHSFECPRTATDSVSDTATTDSVSDIGDRPLEIAASPSQFHEDGIEEEEPEVFGDGHLDSEIDIEQIEMH